MTSKLTRFLPLLLWLALIFAFSSSHNPYRLVAAWLGLSVPAAPGAEFRLLPFLTNETLGNLSHFFEYLVLGLLADYAFRPATPRRRWLVWAFCLLAALSDEIHQIFVPERSFQLLDLALDSLASLLGLHLPAWLHRRRTVQPQPPAQPLP